MDNSNKLKYHNTHYTHYALEYKNQSNIQSNEQFSVHAKNKTILYQLVEQINIERKNYEILEEEYNNLKIK